MIRCLWLAVGFCCSLGFAAPNVLAQSTRAQEQFALGLEAIADGDTAAGLARLERAVSLDPSFAEANYLIGRILARRATGEAYDSGTRLRARKALEDAVRYDPENPAYALELAKLLLKQQIRVDGRRMLYRALELAARADAETYAEIHFQLALFEEAQWLRFRHRHMTLPMFGPVSAQLTLQDAQYAWDMTEPMFLAGQDQGFLKREAMLDHLEQALSVNPGHIGAASHMLAYLYDEGLRDEYLDFARDFVRFSPAEPRAYLTLGLGLTWAGRNDEAAGAFELAMALMPRDERAEYENISRLMTREREREYAELSAEAQAETHRRFWQQNNPLFLTPTNEYWLDYMSRMTYADIRFGVQEYNLHGWQTDRGIIYLRYGAPARIATYSSEPTVSALDMDAVGRVVTLWTYGPRGPAFMFVQNPGFRRSSFALDFRWYADEYRAIQPNRMLAVSIPERYPVPIQVARFRGTGEEMVVEVHALLPLDRLSQTVDVESGELEMGFFVRDRAARELVRRVHKEIVDFREDAVERLDSWRIGLPAFGEYLVSVEAREPLTWHAAVGRESVSPRVFTEGELALSDVLLAYSVEPPPGLEQQTREGYGIVANPKLAYSVEQPVAMYFEVYNLVPDEDGYGSFEIELAITLEQIDRTDRGLVGRLMGDIADRWGFTPAGTDAAQVRFARQARVLVQDVMPEHFTIQLPGAPAGNYTVNVRVRDQVSGAEAVTERTFVIDQNGSAR